MQVAEEGNFIAVVPQGYRVSWNAGACCGTAAREEIDDVGFADSTSASADAGAHPPHLPAPGSTRAAPPPPPAASHRFTRAMVAYVAELACVDPDRIFSAGYSNGGYMSYRLACEASDLVRTAIHAADAPRGGRGGSDPAYARACVYTRMCACTL